MSDHFIDPSWVAAVRGTTFLYPCAGCDWNESLLALGDELNEFWFCDLHYRRGLRLSEAPGRALRWRRLSSEVIGDADAELELPTESRPYRHLPPSRLEEVYERKNGTTVKIVRRRGFAQMVLTNEFADRKIGVFMHRGDSLGDGGSARYFLANKHSSYPPVGHLFDKLSHCLTYKALIISDGSNTDIPHLKKNHNSNIGGYEAFTDLKTKEFLFGEFVWQCVGWLSRRYGPTLVWGVERRIVSPGEIDEGYVQTRTSSPSHPQLLHWKCERLESSGATLCGSRCASVGVPRDHPGVAARPWLV
jgi:hypothetical protein